MSGVCPLPRRRPAAKKPAAKKTAAKKKPAPKKTATKNPGAATKKKTTTTAAANSKARANNKFQGPASGGRNLNKGFKPNVIGKGRGNYADSMDDSQVDRLVDLLLVDGTTGKKNLTKGEEKTRSQVEEYLRRELELDEKEGVSMGNGRRGRKYNDDEEDDDEFSMGSDDDDDQDDDDDGSGSGDYDEDSMGASDGSYSDEKGQENGRGGRSDKEDNKPFSLEALKRFTDQKAQGKRKSGSGYGSTKMAAKPKASSNSNGNSKNNKNGASQAKKSKPSETNKRRSLPAETGKTGTANTETPKFVRKSTSAINAEKPSSTAPALISNSAAKAGSLRPEGLAPPASIAKMNSITEGEKAFRWLLNPIKIEEFFGKYWEKNASLVRRQKANYYKHLISFEAIDKMLLDNHVEFTKNIDITSYKNGVRQTLNPEGRALPPAVWDQYGQGCSIRLLNPQTFLPPLHALSVTMQEYFHCLVGANAYLTPPNSQGFAPHYDDIEAFVLQVEGRKRWRLYKPRSTAEMLPRYSSPNFTQQEIGSPILDEVLEPGDILYFPRGTIHQASTQPGYHSLHLTLSVYQRQSYADLFEKMMPVILKQAIANNVDLRRGLPLHTWHNAGLAFSETDSQQRESFLRTVSSLMSKCLQSIPLADVIDASVDQLAKKFQHEALPPLIHGVEKVRTIFGSRSHTNERGECVCDYELNVTTNVRLLRANIVRLVKEEAEEEGGRKEKKLRVYYYVDNSKEYCQYEPNFIEIAANEAASIEILMKSYPAYIGVSQLPLPRDQRKIELATALWERGLLMTEKPFNN